MWIFLLFLLNFLGWIVAICAWLLAYSEKGRPKILKGLPTKIKYVITKIKNLGCGAGPIGPHLGQSLGKALSINQWESPKSSHFSQPVDKLKKKEERRRKTGRKERTTSMFFQPTLPHVFFSKYIQAIHFFHPPFLKFYSRQTQREKEVQDFTVHCRLSTAACPPPTAKCMQPGLGQNSFSALFFFFFLFLIFCCSNFSFVVLFKLVFWERLFCVLIVCYRWFWNRHWACISISSSFLSFCFFADSAFLFSLKSAILCRWSKWTLGFFYQRLPLASKCMTVKV